MIDRQLRSAVGVQAELVRAEANCLRPYEGGVAGFWASLLPLPS